MMWVVHICIMKRKNFTAYNYQVEITTVEPEKAEKKNADELKDKLIMWKAREKARESFSRQLAAKVVL